MCIDYEVDGEPQGRDPQNFVEEILVAGGATMINHDIPVVASFDDVGAAMEHAIVAQWRTRSRDSGNAMRKRKSDRLLWNR